MLQFVACTGYSARHRIVKKFFTIPTNDNNIETLPIKHAENSQISESTLAHFYTKLREYHDINDADIDDSIPHDFYSEKLRPTLRNYQNRAVRWMIHRERKLKYFPTECRSLPLKYEHFNQCSRFFYNPRTMEIVPDTISGSVKIPSGGILADEMGLGKTVEMLALILHNPRMMKRKRTESILNEDNLGPPVAFQKKLHRIKCICQRRSMKHVIQCVECHLFQHIKCVLTKSHADNNEPYWCPECWKSKPMVLSSSTFIVSPPSIKLQWEDEVATHIVGGTSFKVLIYNGIKHSENWISPADLAKYDIVITDYNTLKQELHFANVKNENRCSRYERRSIIPMCPLKHVHWWRVCLDEAQMVEATVANASQMVKQLSGILMFK